MYLVVSEGRGVEYASKSKDKCKEVILKLQEDDFENNGVDTYYIDEDNTGFYKKEGWQ